MSSLLSSVVKGQKKTLYCFRLFQRQLTRRRNLSLSLSSAGNNNYSSLWQSVDNVKTNNNKFDAPDPIKYLETLDSQSCIKPYRKALLRALELNDDEDDINMNIKMKRPLQILDVGCGLGGGTTHAEISKQLDNNNNFGEKSRLVGIDISETLIQKAIQKSQENNYDHNTFYQKANVYNLPFPNNTFDICFADRVFQHLIRPYDALQEMIRVTNTSSSSSSCGGLIVIADPDFRTFQIDVTGAGCNTRYNPSGYAFDCNHYKYNSNAEAGRRWGESRRPPSELCFDLGGLTTKILNHVIPTLSAHSYMGLAQPRLLQEAALPYYINEIEMEVIPVLLQGREELEAVVPITYMTQLAVDNSNGALTREEADLWLQRLEWEGNERLFGSINFYISRVRVSPTSSSSSNTITKKCFGTKITTASRNRKQVVQEPTQSNEKEQPVKQEKERDDEIIYRFACPNKDSKLIQKAEKLINNKYASSDTGITLSSTRLDEGDAMIFAQKKQLILALNNKTGELLGTIQIKIKDDTVEEGEGEGQNNKNKGLPNVSSRNSNTNNTKKNKEKVAEFTCLAVKSDKTYYIENVKTLQVKVIETSSSTQATKAQANSSKRGRGIGSSLVRYAEAYAQGEKQCTLMQLAIMCPDVPHKEEPKMKQVLQDFYKKLGYENTTEISLGFEVNEDGTKVIRDEMNDMYKSLNQLVRCKAIIMQKSL